MSLKPCPFCGSDGFNHQGGIMCSNSDCFMFNVCVSEQFWNNRPIESDLMEWKSHFKEENKRLTKQISLMQCCANCEYSGGVWFVQKMLNCYKCEGQNWKLKNALNKALVEYSERIKNETNQRAEPGR